MRAASSASPATAHQTGEAVIETLAQIKAPHFTVGIVLFDDRVVEGPPIVRYMRGWSRDRVRTYCGEKDWKVSIVHQIERHDIDAKGRATVELKQGERGRT